MFFYLGYGAFTVVLSMYCQDIGMSASQIAYIVSFAPLLSIATQPFLDTWQISGNHQEKYLFIIICEYNFVCLFLQFSRNFWILLLSSGLAVSFMNAVTPLTDRIGVSSPYQFGKISFMGFCRLCHYGTS